MIRQLLCSTFLKVSAGFALVVLSTSANAAQLVKPPIAPVGPITLGPSFYLRSYMGKCLDFGAPPPPGSQAASQIVLFDCNGSASQQIQIDESPGQHNVVL